MPLSKTHPHVTPPFPVRSEVVWHKMQQVQRLTFADFALKCNSIDARSNRIRLLFSGQASGARVQIEGNETVARGLFIFNQSLLRLGIVIDESCLEDYQFLRILVAHVV